MNPRVQLFTPIVEFFPVFNLGSVSVFDDKNENHEPLRKALVAKKGIYSFYNSEGEIIYVGQSSTNLWRRMRQSFEREKARYEGYFVNHPRERFSPRQDQRVRKIKRMPLRLEEAAELFSAYEIAAKNIDPIEQLIIRLIPNDLINIRMEGNLSLRAARKVRHR